MVPTLASVEIFTCSGFNVTGFPKITLVGVPNCTVLISHVTGAVPISFLAKKTSTAVKYAPLISSFALIAFGASIFPPTTKDCASGS